MTRRLIFLCHAATAASRSAAFPADEPIDARGRAEAEALRTLLPRAEGMWTSPALRARETCTILGLAAPAEPMLRDGDCGRWAGRSLAEVARDEPAAVEAWLGDPEAAPHGGESRAALAARVGAWLDARQVEPVVRRSLAVTHAAVIRAAVLHALGAPPAAFWRIDVAPLSWTVLQGDGRRWTLAALNRGPLPAATDRA